MIVVSGIYSPSDAGLCPKPLLSVFTEICKTTTSNLDGTSNHLNQKLDTFIRVNAINWSGTVANIIVTKGMD